jgi:hypothetical protein
MIQLLRGLSTSFEAENIRGTGREYIGHRHRRMARGDQLTMNFLKFHPCSPCLTLLTLQGWPVCRVGGLRLSFTILDTLRHAPMVLTLPRTCHCRLHLCMRELLSGLSVWRRVCLSTILHLSSRIAYLSRESYNSRPFCWEEAWEDGNRWP